MKAMRVEMAFFDKDEMLSRDMVLVYGEEDTCEIHAERGEKFLVTRKFEEPASSLLIKCFSSENELIFRSALRIGVHNSEDWEMTELAEPYKLCFKCAIVDCDNPNWATQEPEKESDI